MYLPHREPTLWSGTIAILKRARGNAVSRTQGFEARRSGSTEDNGRYRTFLEPNIGARLKCSRKASYRLLQCVTVEDYVA